VAMREFFQSVIECLRALKVQLSAAVSIPLFDLANFEDFEAAGVDHMVSCDAQKPVGTLFDCVTEHPGRMTRNGRGSLEIGAAHDD
jgi:hypothetical protein